MTGGVSDPPIAARLTLPGAVRAALHAAAVIVAERSAQPIEPEAVVTDADGITRLLGLLEQVAPLRAATAAALRGHAEPEQEGGDVVAQLLSADAAVAARGAQSVRGMLAAARRARGRAARQAGRADRVVPQEREAARADRRATELRVARDRARAQAAAAEADAARLRDENAGLAEELIALEARAAAAEAQLAAARRDAADPVRAAGQLAAALAPAEVRLPADSRGVGSGEPERVDPTRHDVAGPAADPARLAVAARVAGLPADVADTAPAWLPRLLEAFVRPPQPVAVVHERQLRVDVLGGGAEVGGSCVLVTAGDTRLLVDAGSWPGGTDADSLAPRRIQEAFAGPLHGIVVTHAHNDHAGWVPAVLVRRPDTPVYVTAPTADLLATMWFDSAKVLARRGGTASAAPFDRSDVERALARLVPTAFGRRQRVGDCEIELFAAGHIVGAAGVVVHVGEARVVVSGDVSRPGQKTVGGIEIPDSAKGADLLLLESTYAGSGRRTPREAEVAQLVRDVTTVTSAGGRVLIPAFALGRAQEVAAVLAEHLPDVEVLVDGLAREVTAVYESHAGPDGGPLRIFGPRVRRVPVGGTQQAIAALRSGVVIATSGMLTAGPAVSWARELLPDPAAGLMIVGYQDEESPGGRLLALAEAGGGEFELPTAAGGPPSPVTVAAHVARYGLGAHATADELVGITAEVGAGEVMLVHGEPSGQAAFRQRLAVRQQATTPAGLWRPPVTVPAA
ncbi:MBL fold metallo-hydrolase [Geodermatophilus sp. URMC 61]|uniref:MBL fold metallo-hydrolase n=1 Tax=Geodermatophilus sp. URMC 61 TaxID=3423411 RepID=UPI00406C20B6